MTPSIGSDGESKTAHTRRARNPEALQRLHRQAERLMARQGRLNVAQRRLSADRDEVMRKAHDAELPLSEIAAAFGIDASRVSRILARSRPE